MITFDQALDDPIKMQQAKGRGRRPPLTVQPPTPLSIDQRLQPAVDLLAAKVERHLH
jgi:hypothetical protein